LWLVRTPERTVCVVLVTRLPADEMLSVNTYLPSPPAVRGMVTVAGTVMTSPLLLPPNLPPDHQDPPDPQVH